MKKDNYHYNLFYYNLNKYNYSMCIKLSPFILFILIFNAYNNYKISPGNSAAMITIVIIIIITTHHK